MERRVINPWGWQDQFGFVHAVEIAGSQRMFYCSGQASADAAGHPVHIGNMRAQLGQAMDNLEAVLRHAGYSLSDVVRLNYYTTDVDVFLSNFDEVASRLSAAGARVTSTLLGVARLAFPELLVEIEATAAK